MEVVVPATETAGKTHHEFPTQLHLVWARQRLDSRSNARAPPAVIGRHSRPSEKDETEAMGPCFINKRRPLRPPQAPVGANF
jgi:hypothetical protein